MKAKKINEPKDYQKHLTDDNYVAELKYDGQRRFLQWKDGEVKLFNKQMEKRKCPQEIIDAVLLSFSKEKSDIFSEFTLDGELVYIDRAKNTHHRTQAQNKNAELTYMVFDIISIGNEPCTDKSKDYIWTWEHRRVELESICSHGNWVPEADGVIQLVYFVSSTEYKQKLLVFAREQKLEGIILKNKNATYDSKGKTDMIKVKFTETDDYIVIGYTDASEKSVNTKGETIDNKRYPYFKALALAQYDKEGVLKSKAQVGGGFTNKDLLEITPMLKKQDYRYFYNKTAIQIMEGLTNKQVKPRITDKNFNKPYGTIAWLKKEDYFVIEIKMMNKTEYGNPFEPRFLRLRDDKKPMDCLEE